MAVSAIKRIEISHGCGFKTDWPAAMAKHAMHCDGKPVQTRGRIDRLAHRSEERTPPAAKKVHTVRSSRVPRSHTKPAVRRSRASAASNALVPVPSAPLSVTSLRLTFLGQLHDARDRIDTAITAIEALG